MFKSFLLDYINVTSVPNYWSKNCKQQGPLVLCSDQTLK